MAFSAQWFSARVPSSVHNHIKLDYKGTCLSAERGDCRFIEAFASEWVIFYRLKKKSSFKKFKGKSLSFCTSYDFIYCSFTTLTPAGRGRGGVGGYNKTALFCSFEEMLSEAIWLDNELKKFRTSRMGFLEGKCTRPQSLGFIFHRAVEKLFSASRTLGATTCIKPQVKHCLIYMIFNCSKIYSLNHF